MDRDPRHSGGTDAALQAPALRVRSGGSNREFLRSWLFPILWATVVGVAGFWLQSFLHTDSPAPGPLRLEVALGWFLLSALGALLMFAALRLRRQVAVLQLTRAELDSHRRRLQAILDNSEMLIYLKDEQGRYLFVNRAFELLTGRMHDQVVGRRDEDIFPADLAKAYSATDAQVLAGGNRLNCEDSYPVGDSVRTYLTTKFLITEPVTGSRSVCGITFDITERVRAEKAARQAREQLADIIASVPGAVYEVRVGEGSLARFTFVTERISELYEITADQVKQSLNSLDRFTHPDDFDRIVATSTRAAQALAPWMDDWRITTPSGKKKWVRGRATPRLEADGSMVWTGVLLDVTEEITAQERLHDTLSHREQLLAREHTLLRELNHRVRNNLASLLGLVRIYESADKGPSDVARAIREKVHAMKEAHDLITLRGGRSVGLAEIIARLSDGALSYGAAGKLRAEGPPVGVPSSQGAAVAMIIQELLTNSLKHGALGRGDGSVGVAWVTESTEGGERLTLDWTERGVTELSPPQRLGVGLKLIEGLAGGELAGSCTFRFEPPGLACRITVLLDHREDLGKKPANGESFPVESPWHIAAGESKS